MKPCDLCGNWNGQRVRDETLCPRCQAIDADARRTEAER